MRINDPETLAEVEAAFRQYEEALMVNDIEALDALFWEASLTVRYGPGQNLYGTEAIKAFRRDLNVVLSRGVWRIFAVAINQYQRTLEAHNLLDFSGVLEKSVKLLREMDEFVKAARTCDIR